MSARHLYRPPPLLVLLLFIFSVILPSQSDELQILLKFKSALEKSNTSVFDTWTQGNSVRNFTGIVCNSNGFVTEILLAEQQLEGVLPFDSICELKSLEKIDLGANVLHGGIGEGLKNCSQLQYLDLGVNFFTGTVPELSSLSGLKFLNLNCSGFSGSFPWKSLENLTNLEFLSLGDNQFERSSFPLEILKLEKLYWLYLTNSSLEGQVPEGIGNLTQLRNLELSDNYLHGEIPVGIGKLSKLWQLELYDNRFSGKFPEGFGNLTNLVNFDASNNSLEGDLSELRFLTKLASLQLFENQFSGEVPQEFGEFKYLEEFSLYTNNLTGPLPQKLGSWADLTFIDVSENFLTGAIPPEMCKQGKLGALTVLKNKFTGEIPANYANCLPLKRLRVNNNFLSGIVPAGIWSLPNLSLIDFRVNHFHGPVTSDIGNAKSLAQLFLADNEFSGELPEEISKASLLVVIDLSSNKFSGKIPATIGELKALNSLNLQENKFSGPIPESLGSCVSLDDVNLSGNSLSGEIPESLGTLSTLNSLNLSNNQLSGEIPSSLSSLRLSLLDLTNNKLSGRVPESLSAYNGSFSGNPDLCSETITHFRSCSSNPGLSGDLRRVISCFVAVAAVMLICTACFIIVKIRSKDHDRLIKSDSWDLKSFRSLSFSESEIINSIKQDNLIGKGASGNVYKVVLGNGTELAVKHMWKSDSGDRRACRSTTAMLGKRNRRPSEYEAEVATLSSVRHMNVVKLYCSITSEDSDLLVYEYLRNGSLWDRLHTCQKMEMDWDVRYDIAVGAGRGLEYLHHGCDRTVIHRDVKSSNILLDVDLKPRIADFGLAKMLHGAAGGDTTHVIAGTHGYIAPEYAYTCKVTEKSDVYSFGVVLMELVTGKRPIEPEFGENKDIVYWVYNNMKSREDAVGLVDSAISEAFKEDAVKVLQISIHCTAKIPVLRPSMRMVVQMLEDFKPCKLTNIVVSKGGEGSSPNESLGPIP